jgi:protein arginine N-methyltransferase 5
MPTCPRLCRYAIEKNPNAVLTLESRNAEQWGGRVTVVATDMRRWKPEVRADILVSELLGSFGDNELSPECLDGAQAFLAPDGVSIPASSTSFLTPLSAPKLHIDIATSRDPSKGMETPYVVLLHAAYRLAEPKPLFHFVHPNHDASGPDGGPDNERYVVHVLVCSLSTCFNGLRCARACSVSICPFVPTHSSQLCACRPSACSLSTYPNGLRV